MNGDLSGSLFHCQIQCGTYIHLAKAHHKRRTTTTIANSALVLHVRLAPTQISIFENSSYRPPHRSRAVPKL